MHFYSDIRISLTFRGVLRLLRGVPGIFWGVSGVFRRIPGCSGFVHCAFASGLPTAAKDLRNSSVNSSSAHPHPRAVAGHLLTSKFWRGAFEVLLPPGGLGRTLVHLVPLAYGFALPCGGECKHDVISISSPVDQTWIK